MKKDLKKTLGAAADKLRSSMDAIKGRAKGSTFMEISRRAFLLIPVLVSPLEVVAGFAAVVFIRGAANEYQTGSLAELRDTLLSRLISGKLRIGRAQLQVEGGA